MSQKFDNKTDTSFVVAVTGGIASGKTIFCHQLEDLGFQVIYSDKIAHNVLDQEDVKAEIYKNFPELERQKQINRRELGKIVFSDSKKLESLNAIVHPRVFKELDSRIAASKEKLIFVEIPLLFETGSEARFDYICFIFSHRDDQVKMLKKRNNISLEEIENRLQNQMDNFEKAKQSNLIVVNNSTVSALKLKAEKSVKILHLTVDNAPENCE